VHIEILEGHHLYIVGDAVASRRLLKNSRDLLEPLAVFSCDSLSSNVPLASSVSTSSDRTY